MNHDFQIRTAGCPEYQRLLRECQCALVAWKKRSEEITFGGQQGKEVGDGLQRLQAEYARAYNRLERHAGSCRVCNFPSDYGRRIDSVNGARDNELPT